MSFAADLVDAVLVHVSASVAGVTVHNALTDTFRSEDELGTGDFPWCQGYGVSSEDVAGDFGQRTALYTLNFELLDLPDIGDKVWTDIEAIRAALLADWSLGDTVLRTWMSASGVNETSDRIRTLGAFIVTVAVVE